jgi:hypothetical protein
MIEQFNDLLFRNLVEQVTVRANGVVVVQFKNDSEIQVKL